MSISQRLKAVLDAQGLSIKACAEQLDMPYRTLQNYLLNERDPSADVLIKISRALHVNLNWLMVGDEEEYDLSNKNNLTKKEQMLIDYYRNMSSNNQAAFYILFESLSKK